jgi:hypothetical protein
MKILEVISKADVSHEGLFIGSWTTAEVSLGFVVACSLCLPKLVQVKGKKLKKALSYASSPFSSTSSKSRKSDLWSGSGSVQPNSRGSRQMKQMDVESRPMYYEERQEQQKLAQARLQPPKDPHDIYVLPSTAGNSEYSGSNYSHSVASKRSSEDQHRHIQVATVARHEIPRSISVRTQDVPVRLDPNQMTLEQLDDERRVLQEFDFDSFQVTIHTGPRRQTC